MATPKRQGTMQQTVEEGCEYLKGEGADHLLPDVHDEDDGDHPPAPGRQGTMQVTAAEGIEFLKAAGEEKLLEIQGLLPTNGNGAAKRKHDDEDGNGNGDLLEGAEDDEESNGVPHMAKNGTMHATAKEGEQLLEWMGGAPDPSAKTRAQQRELDSEKDEPDVKKPKVVRDSTIQQTTKPDLAYCPEAIEKKANEIRLSNRAYYGNEAENGAENEAIPLLRAENSGYSDDRNLPLPSESLGTNALNPQSSGSGSSSSGFVNGVAGPTNSGQTNSGSNATSGAASGAGLYHGPFVRPTEEQLMFWCDKGKAIAIERCQLPLIEPKYIEQCGAYFADCRYFFANGEPLRHIANQFTSQFGIGLSIGIGVPFYPVNRDGQVGVSVMGRADYGTWGGGWTDAIGVRDFYEQQREYGANWYDGIYGYREGWSVPIVRNFGVEGEGGTAVSVPINERNLGAPISVDTGYQVGPYFGYDDGVGVDWYHGGVSKTFSVNVPVAGVGVNTGINVDFPSIGDYAGGKRKRRK
uniref:Uncharacterized protein n=1 Tax=Plectus sambesii TaxID=2011161 RepID=A0A914UJH1_9BILA